MTQSTTANIVLPFLKCFVTGCGFGRWCYRLHSGNIQTEETGLGSTAEDKETGVFHHLIKRDGEYCCEIKNTTDSDRKPPE